MDSVTRSLMTIKMQHIRQAGNTAEAQQEKGTLWSYCSTSFEKFVRLCDGKQWEQARILAEKMRLIILGLKGEDFGGRLLREAFLEMEEMYILNADMNVLLLQYKVFPVAQWDRVIVEYIRNCPGQSQNAAFEFLSDVVKRCLYSLKIFTHELITVVTVVLGWSQKIDCFSIIMVLCWLGQGGLHCFPIRICEEEPRSH